MSEDLTPPAAEAEKPQRLKTRIEATIYIQHIIRDFILGNVEAWRVMKDEADSDESRSELGLLVNQGEALAGVLRESNLALAREMSPVVLPGRG